ncbi:MAG: hypothetical protein Tsb002_22790 [Wenzhouxiangellaceae bacterium]
MDTTHEQISRYARWAQWLIVISALLIPLGVLWVWLYPGAWLSAGFGEVSLSRRLLAAAVSMIGVLLQWLMLWQAWRLFDLYRQQQYFAASCGGHLQTLGWLLLLAVPVRVVIHAAIVQILRYPEGSLAIQFGSSEMVLLIAGLLLAALGRVMGLAGRIHDEWRHTY